MKAKRQLLIAGIVTGSLLMLSPVVGLLGSVFGMMHAFSTMSSTGTGDPQALSSSIGTTLISTAAGLLLFPVGVVVLAVSLVLYLRLRTAVPVSQPTEPMN